MARREYSEETKTAVLSALLAGQSISSVAKEYKIPKGTVGYWKNNMESELPTQKSERIGNMILDLLSQELQTLRIMAEVFADKDWLKEQSASELAVLYGVMQDKSFRKLEAPSASNDTTPQD